MKVNMDSNDAFKDIMEDISRIPELVEKEEKKVVLQEEPKQEPEPQEIPKVEIGTSAPSEAAKKKKDSEDFLTPMEIHIKTILSDFYNMSADNINVSIQGG